MKLEISHLGIPMIGNVGPIAASFGYNISKIEYGNLLDENDKIKITKLDQGLPVGGEIEQLDDGNLLSAFKNRVPVTDN